MKSKKELAKEDIGNYDFHSDRAIYISSYNNNVAVSVASNYYTHKTIRTVKRYSNASKCKIDVTQPYIIRKYIEGMGDDVKNKLLGSYHELRSELKREVRISDGY